MSWIVISQCAGVVLSSILIARLFQLRLNSGYLPVIIFLIFDSVSDILYIPFRAYRPFDFRLFFFSTKFIEWSVTIWLVYALLIAILKHLPGILRFSLWVLNFVFAAWIVISWLAAKPEYAVYHVTVNSLARWMVLFYMLDRVFSLAELLVILSILAFVLRFPIQVPRNLARLSAGLCILLFLHTAFVLLFTYVPGFRNTLGVPAIPSYVLSGCLLYWIVTINKAGEESEVTLGRGWQSLPKEHLVRQLEAMNAALLRSREHV
jgi:hypothetical protein